ncbi:hypothetical protein C479_01846 [Halovivax asiaticus JCM 14624]|uniref:Cell division protein A N-terminal domain-containing protein n=1 Tax=Halovivax asiaticus JCM 14624 TaxID=1227490 RepID=M0BT49_9EURY|nr:hypothetical protein [Halovivax asiaticus]ELZ13548.1 hypothetical protein C479_01846 [Halovivax asiaticus JCM 14624]
MSTISEQNLFDLYRSYIGEPDSERDVYVGFGLFLCGIVLAVVALGLFVVATGHPYRSPEFFTWARPAYTLGMVSLPLVMLGIVVLLPSERRVLAVSVVGAAITLVATSGFLFYAYPEHWNGYGNDYTVPIVTVYAIGLAAMAASTGAALIAHYLDLARQIEVTPEADEAKEHYTDEEIANDIDDAMEDVELSWGGVEKSDNTTLTFTGHEFEDTEVGDAGVTKTRSTGVQSQVAGLKGMKGGEAKTQTSTGTVDDQTAKLKELREQKQAEDVATADEGPVGRVRSGLTGAARTFKSKVTAVGRRVKRN